MLTVSHMYARSHAQSHIDSGISNTHAHTCAHSHTRTDQVKLQNKSLSEKSQIWAQEPGLCKNSPAPSNSGSSSQEGVWESGHERETRAGGEGVGREGWGVAGRGQGGLEVKPEA